MKRSTLIPTARDEKRRLYHCARCGRTIREGEEAVILRGTDTVEIRHSGRKCPPAYTRPVVTHPFRPVPFK